MATTNYSSRCKNQIAAGRTNKGQALLKFSSLSLSPAALITTPFKRDLIVLRAQTFEEALSRLAERCGTNRDAMRVPSKHRTLFSTEPREPLSLCSNEKPFLLYFSFTLSANPAASALYVK
jgi:hypothetical protein